MSFPCQANYSANCLIAKVYTRKSTHQENKVKVQMFPFTARRLLISKWEGIWVSVIEIQITRTAWTVSKHGVFSGPYFGVSLHIQCEYGKMRTGKNSVFGHFSRSVESIERRYRDIQSVFYIDHLGFSHNCVNTF